MKLEKSDRERLASRISEEAEYVVHLHTQLHLGEIAQYCDSPIEALLGTAFHFAANTASFIRARATLVYLNESTRDRKPVLPGQWELVPQFSWEGYRIDFAIFTSLDYPIFIECDGHDFHERTKEQAAHDREKDRKIQSAGIPILRFTGSQIHASPLNCGFEIYNFIYKRVQDADQVNAG
jgi:very-short-patch-repair endonuclease